ncbi:enoyl-CoA hydratase-related protein [Rhizorhapis sp. SPR117]|uniref:enoyl-CoA hydratase-related protein n=1 Tax=Rhizorhapis sp. SPR117 TaxID=2912611 RepID=UPI001F0295B5|nr:enoyl-CoA hydratase-related protein [Rhizorhapis sp. SPR117]
MSDYDTIQASIADSVGTITLNRPDRLNALNPAMMGEIVDAVATMPSRGARAILLNAAGRGFCSGTDLQGEGLPEDVGAILEEYYHPGLEQIMAAPLPMVAAVHGATAGIGCSLALVADFVVAARSAYFLQAFVNIGLVPDGGATWMLPRLVGRARAIEMMMLGEKVPAEQAAQWGMIHKTVDDDVLMDKAMELASRLAKGPTHALGLIRNGVSQAMDNTFSQTLAMERQHQREAGYSADFKAGVQAFLAKRAPIFEGK